MFRTHDRPALAGLALAGCLAAAVAVSAQTKAKPEDSQKAPRKSAAASKAEENYKATCQACHLADGQGLTPDMSFTDGQWKHGSTTQAIAKTIREGVAGTLMLPFKDKFSDAEILELAKLVKAFEPKTPPAKTRKRPQPQPRASLRVPRLQRAGVGPREREI
jgi:mono/diheme cytochrome c family protein